jgi:hypothetical protein
MDTAQLVRKLEFDSRRRDNKLRAQLEAERNKPLKQRLPRLVSEKDMTRRWQQIKKALPRF